MLRNVQVIKTKAEQRTGAHVSGSISVKGHSAVCGRLLTALLLPPPPKKTLFHPPSIPLPTPGRQMRWDGKVQYHQSRFIMRCHWRSNDHSHPSRGLRHRIQQLSGTHRSVVLLFLLFENTRHPIPDFCGRYMLMDSGRTSGSQNLRSLFARDQPS